jgi:hypothetical protein
MSEEEARQAAWRAALAMSQNDRHIAAVLVRNTEFDVLRRLVSAQLPGGEMEYWELVEKELRK